MKVSRFFLCLHAKTLSYSVVDTLNNVADSPEEALYLSGDGIAPFTAAAPPECRIGVSLKNVLESDYVPPAGYQWYALRVTYGRELEAEKLILRQGILTYVPKQKNLKMIRGKRKKVTESLVPNLLFVFTDRKTATMLTSIPLKSNNPRRDKAPVEVRFMYDHTAKDKYGRDTVVIIPRLHMENFIRFTIKGEASIRNVTGDEIRFKQDEQVMITEGTFKGVVGRVARIQRQTCVVVDLQNVCMLATAYIPKVFLRKVEDTDLNTVVER